MAEHTRRVGLLKAVGGTPGLVAAVLLAENLLVALVAAAAGLLGGWLGAPLITPPRRVGGGVAPRRPAAGAPRAPPAPRPHQHGQRAGHCVPYHGVPPAAAA